MYSSATTSSLIEMEGVLIIALYQDFDFNVSLWKLENCVRDRSHPHTSYFKTNQEVKQEVWATKDLSQCKLDVHKVTVRSNGVCVQARTGILHCTAM